MSIKIFSAIVAMVLMFVFLIPMVYKLKDGGLVAMVLIGLGMMLVDLWQSLQSKDN